MRSTIYFFMILILCFYCCDENGNKPVKGFLEISYELKKVKGIEPSYQTVIWLENKNREYVKSLLVSEYLSYGGFNDSTICPDWSKIADWENVSDEDFDAVTQATPSIGPNIVKIDCREEKLLPGKYRYCVQVHIVEEYNELYCGEIILSGKNTANIAEISYIPSRYSIASDVITNVKAKYYQ